MAIMPSMLVCLALTTAVETAAGEGSRYRPTGSAADLSDLGLLARLRDPRVMPFVIDSDQIRPSPAPIPALTEPAGAKSITRLLLAEIAGPLIVQRISLIGPTSLPRDFDRSEIQLRVYQAGLDEAILVLPLDTLATGRHPHFPPPMAGQAGGELFSYVPLAFDKGCRIVLDGRHASLYRAQVSGVTFPRTSEVTVFQEPVPSSEQVQLDKAAAAWSSRSDPIVSVGEPTESSDYVVDGAARSTQRFLLPAGPRTVRSLEIEPAACTSDAWRDARLKLFWESDRAAGADLPLGFAFARLPGVEPGSSLLMGSSGPAWFNRFPMPYRRQAFLQIDSDAAIRGTIHVRSTRGVAADAGYLRVSFWQGRIGTTRPASKPFVGFPPVELRGRGHYAGALLAVQGPSSGRPRRADAARGADDVHCVISGLGVVLAIRGFPAQTAGWDASPAHGLFDGPGDAMTGHAAVFRWHPADPIPFDRSTDVTIVPGDRTDLATDLRAALAVFWYSEQPSPFNPGQSSMDLGQFSEFAELTCTLRAILR